jgi:hypothetical protein
MRPRILLAVFVFPVSGYATEWIAYDKAAFVKAQEAGKWCWWPFTPTGEQLTDKSFLSSKA